VIVETLSFMDQIELLVACSEHEEDPRVVLNAAVTVMAEALVAGVPLDKERLQLLAFRCGLYVRSSTFPKLFGAARFVSAIVTYVEKQEITMFDGRIATKDGWRTDNNLPDDEFENAAW
jgi:hypothetical protein